MRRYRTEIVVPEDRCVVLHLPLDLPEGRAVVTVELDPEDAGDLEDGFGPDDLTDIEWWEEFGEPGADTDDDPWRLAARSYALEA